VTLGICRLPIGMNHGSVDADAAAWAAAVTANGGTYSASTLAAVSTFAASAKASGYWTKLNRINLFAGGGGTAAQNFAGCLVPLKVGGGSATETNVNFVAGDYTEATGLTGNGSTKYLNTGLVPSASLTLNDTHMAFYDRGSSAVGLAVAMGVSNVGIFRLWAPNSDSKVYSDAYDTVSGRVVTAGTIATPFGFIGASRISAVDHTIYRNGSSVATNATSGGSLPGVQAVYVFAENNAGVAANWSALIAGGYSIGSGLTAADVTAYNTHMQAFQTALSRNV
jgi:hypothetical protein